MSEDNGKQNSEEPYTNKYQKHIACSYSCKLLCADDKFSKPFKKYLGEDAIGNIISNMIEESKYCRDVMRKRFNKDLLMTKKNKENFKNCTKCWICDNDYVGNDVKVRDHSHITGKYKGSAHRDYDINLKLNHKILVVFHNLKNYDSHLIMHDLDQFSTKINAIPNELEKYMIFTINDFIINKFY